MRYATSNTTQPGNGRKCAHLVQRECEQNWSPEDGLSMSSAASPEPESVSSGEEGGQEHYKVGIYTHEYVISARDI